MLTTRPADADAAADSHRAGPREGPSFDTVGCLERVRRRDEAAARELVEHLQDLVQRIVRAHLPRRGGEEDLMQEVFGKMFSRLDQYRGPLPFEHWVSRIAVTTCLDALRAQARRPELRWADLSEETAAALEAAHGRTETQPTDELSGAGTAARELVDELMATLSPPDRLVITLLDLEERSVAEIGELTGWGASMIKVRAFRARRKLRKALDQLERGRRPVVKPALQP